MSLTDFSQSNWGAAKKFRLVLREQGAVREMGGPYCEEHTVKSKDSSNVWKQYSLEQEVCKGMKFLRIETSIRSIGNISFDSFSFEKIR